MSGEMFGFWMMTGFGMFFFLVLVGAGLNCYFRAKASILNRLEYVEETHTIRPLNQSLSEKANEE